MLLTNPHPPHLNRAALQACRAEWLAQSEVPDHLLDARGLVDLCARRGIEGLDEILLLHLWQEGLLRADLVVAEADPGVAFQPVAGRASWYVDARPAASPQSWDELLAGAPLPRRGVQPLFHPHRFVLLLALTQMLRIRAPGTTRLYSLEELAELFARVAAPRPRAGLAEAWEALQTWCELAIALEPPEAYGTRIVELLREIGEPTLRDVHARLCGAAMQVDDNRSVHALVRFLDAHRREGISGALGAALGLLAIAEQIRRTAERALEIELPEEDEADAGAALEGIKQRLYGSARVLDEDRSRRTLLRLLQLDASCRVRCYVEGATELGALRTGLRHVPGVAIVDLGGQRAEPERRDAVFAESLRHDLEQHVYSYVLLDGEREDTVWVVTRAAEQEQMFGGFHATRPDVEFENFTPAELTQILWGAIRADGAMRAFCDQAGFALEDLGARVEKSTTAADLFRRLDSSVPELGLCRGEAWGATLMAFAARHPRAQDGVERPLVTLVREIVHATRVPYSASLSRLRVDPSCGTLIERQV